MAEATLLLTDLPAGSRRKVTADFPGGLILSDGGFALLRGPDRRLDQAEAQVICIGESRNPKRMTEKNLAGTWDMPPDGLGRRGLGYDPSCPATADCLAVFAKRRPARLKHSQIL